MSKTETVFGFLIILGILGISYLTLFGYSELSKHQITITIDTSTIVPTGKVGDGSAYLVRTNSTERPQIELQRAWYMFGDNIDTLYFDLKNKQGQTVTLECFGWYIPAFYWYDQCFKEV